MFSRPGLISAIVLAACVAWSAPAWAHSAVKAAAESPAASVPAPMAAAMAASTAAAAAPSVPWPAILAAAAALIVAWRRPRRALALAIVLILALFAFENGVHSVHHLNDVRHLEDLRSGLTCHVAAATAHLSGTPVDVATHESLVLPSHESVLVLAQPDVDTRSLSAHQGRAPPLSA